MKHILATLSVVALIALPGCCCKKKETPSKPPVAMKKEEGKKQHHRDMKKSCHDHDKPKKGCKSCKDKEDTSYSKHSYLELEAADEFLL